MPVSLPEPAYDAELRALHRADQRRLSARYLQRLSWSRERIDEERRRRLRQLVGVAQERSPWHRRRLARFDPAALQEGELSQFPIMTKEDVMANFDDIVTDRRLGLSRVESHLAGAGRHATLSARALPAGGVGRVERRARSVRL